MRAASRRGWLLLLVLWSTAPGTAAAGLAGVDETEEEFPAAPARRTSNAPLAVQDRPTCLNVAGFNYSNRSNVFFGGKSMPIRVTRGYWASAQILTMLFKIISEEMLGVFVTGGYVASNTPAAYLSLVCEKPTEDQKDPANLECCQPPTGTNGHVAMEIWTRAIRGNTLFITSLCRDKLPLRKTPNFGFAGEEPQYVADVASVPADKVDLPLEYYRSYTHPTANPKGFFQTIFDIPSEKMRWCNNTKMHTDTKGVIRDYRKSQGGKDPNGFYADGVDAAGETVYKMDCSWGGQKWWLAPKCRQNASLCIPVISGGDGWQIGQIMQKATAHGLPWAAGVATGWSDYAALPTTHAILFYWWWPDATFNTIKPKKVIFPVYNKREWEAGNEATMSQAGAIANFATVEILNKANTGFDRPIAMLDKIELSPQQMQDLLDQYVSMGNTDAVLYDLVCNWLNNNLAIWYTGDKKWLPEETTCVEGQGLKSETGAWVSTRAAARSCDWCATGRMSKRITSEQTYECMACPAGKHQNTLGEVECVDCNTGEAGAVEGLAACTKCPSGTFSSSTGQSVCQACPATFITTFAGSESVDSCICKEEFYRSKDSRNQCTECKKGMTCPRGSDELGYDPAFASRYRTVPLLKAGMWSSAEAPLEVFACESKSRCPGDKRPGDACQTRLQKQGCSQCEENYAWSGTECEICGSKSLTMFVFPVLPLLLMPVVILLLYKLFGDTYHRWGTWRNGIAAGVFIVLNFFQIVNMMRTTNIAWPREVVGVMGFFAAASDLSSIFRPDCAGYGDFKSGLLMRSLVPAILALMYVIVWGCSQVVGRWVPLVKMEINRTLNGFFSLIFTFFAGITEMAFTIFKCSPNPNGTSSLQTDRSITCAEGEWNGMLAIGICAVLFWCMGFGLLFAWAIYNAPHHFHNKAMQMRWKFLFIRYRPDVHWWAVIFLLKGFALNLGSVLLTSGASQLVWLAIGLMGYTCVLAVCRPWRHMTNNGMDAWAHLSLMLVCCIAIWYSRETADDISATDSLMEKFCATFLFTCLLPIPLLVPMMIMSQTAKYYVDKKNHNIELIVDAFDVVNGADAESQEMFLEQLSEWDFWFMLHAKNVVYTGLVRQKARWGYSVHRLSERDRDSQNSGGGSRFGSQAMYANKKAKNDGNTNLMIINI